MAIRSFACASLVLLSSVSAGGPRSIAIAAGDCKDAELLGGATSFSDAVATLIKGDAVDAAALLDRLKPRPTAGMDDVQRQVDGAQSLFYAGQLDKALEGVKGAEKSLERMVPSEAVTKQLIAAHVLEGLILKGLNKKNEQLEAWKRVLRVSPEYKLDPDFHSPAAIAQFDQLKKDMAKLKKVPLTVTSTPAGARVFLDGVEIGKTPVKNASYIPGDYHLMLTQGDLVSFVNDVKLDATPVELTVDLGFEGAVRGMLPLCVNATDSDALKLARLATADQALVLRVDNRSGAPGWVSAVLYDATRGARVREGGMKIADARKGNGYADLASFVLTGQPATLAMSSSSSRPEPAAVAAPVVDSAPAPAPVETSATASSGSMVPKILSGTIMGAGVVVAGAGIVIYALGGKDRSDLGDALGPNGEVKMGTSFTPEQIADVDAKVRGNHTTTIALVTTGLVVAAAGAVLFFVLGSRDSPQVTWFMTPEGVYGGLAGSF